MGVDVIFEAVKNGSVISNALVYAGKRKDDAAR